MTYHLDANNAAITDAELTRLRKVNGVLLDAVRLAVDELSKYERGERTDIDTVVKALRDTVAKYTPKRSTTP